MAVDVVAHDYMFVCLLRPARRCPIKAAMFGAEAHRGIEPSLLTSLLFFLSPTPLSPLYDPKRIFLPFFQYNSIFPSPHLIYIQGYFKMKVVGLISGGKDSLFSLGKCLEYGHDLVCVANLAPERSDEEELDSFCFQTVGHTHIAAVADALGLPLVQGNIKAGTSNVTSMSYPTRPDDTTDEVERLFDLLADVKNRFPDVTAVCSGAILSNYQRLRVESVCARLGLFSLAYIWQRDQDDYIAELRDQDYEARIIKIASMGMKIKHLGSPLGDLVDYLAGVEYCHSAGEGGEYESFVTDCPLYKTRLVMTETEVMRLNNDDYAPEARITFKLGTEEKPVQEGRLLPQKVVTAPQHKYFDANAPTLGGAAPASRSWVSQCGRWKLWAGLSRDCAEGLTSTTSALLGEVPCLEKAAFVHVYGKSIAGFADVNKGYNVMFGSNPPSRAFVEVAGQEHGVTLDALCYDGERGTLHVQSISEWAPACIGPYAQATTLGTTVLHAGMLGLDPPTMTLVGPVEADRTAAVTAQAVRALESYHAVMPIVESSMESVGFGIAYVVHAEDTPAVAAVWQKDHQSVPLLVVSVSALPKYAAFELQLMSAVKKVRPTVEAEGKFVLTRFENMAYCVASLDDLAEALQYFAGKGLEAGHVKVFAQQGATFVDVDVPVTLLPTEGYVLLILWVLSTALPKECYFHQRHIHL